MFIVQYEALALFLFLQKQEYMRLVINTGGLLLY